MMTIIGYWYYWYYCHLRSFGARVPNKGWTDSLIVERLLMSRQGRTIRRTADRCAPSRFRGKVSWHVLAYESWRICGPKRQLWSRASLTFTGLWFCELCWSVSISFLHCLDKKGIASWAKMPLSTTPSIPSMAHWESLWHDFPWSPAVAWSGFLQVGPGVAGKGSQGSHGSRFGKSWQSKNIRSIHGQRPLHLHKRPVIFIDLKYVKNV